MVRRLGKALFTSLIVGCVTLASGAAAVAARDRAPAAHLTLPAPTGPYPVGTTDLHLIDHSRANPWMASPAHRELMISLWYPATDVRRVSLAPHMLPGAAAHFGSAAGAGSTLYKIPADSVDFAATRTGGHEGAPVARPKRPYPVVLYSPGAGDPRSWGTTLVQDLASRGYVVVTIDHTYDASEVEFPDGRVVGGLLQQLFGEVEQPSDFEALAAKIFAVRAADTRFVLDQLTALDSGTNPDAEGRPLPAGVAGALDLRRTGMLGVSAGGLTALQSMDDDPRLKAAVDIGGSIEPAPVPLWPVAQHGLDRPFMLIGNPPFDEEHPAMDHHQTPSWQMLWDKSSGWRADVQLKGAKGEDSYKDSVPLIPQIARQLGLPASFVTQAVGTIDLNRAVPTEEALVAAFFDRWLRGGRHDQVLDGPDPRFPDITYIR